MKPGVIVYTATMCNHCLKLKEFLESSSIQFEEKNIGTAESLTELRVNGCFSVQAPILKIWGRVFTDRDLFEGEEIKEKLVEDLMKIIVKNTSTG